MNQEDMAAVELFRRVGLIEFARIPAALLDERYKVDWTHIVRLREPGWALVSQLRCRRAEHHGPFAAKCIAMLVERERFSSTEDGSQAPLASDGEGFSEGEMPTEPKSSKTSEPPQKDNGQ